MTKCLTILLRIPQDTGSILDRNTWRMVKVSVEWPKKYLKTGREDKVQWRVHKKTTVTSMLIHLLTSHFKICQNTVIASGHNSKSHRWHPFQVVQGSWVSNLFREGYKVHSFHFPWFNHSNRLSIIIKQFKNSWRALDHFFVYSGDRASRNNYNK
jgi:hypothetical protein